MAMTESQQCMFVCSKPQPAQTHPQLQWASTTPENHAYELVLFGVTVWCEWSCVLCAM